MVFATWTYLSRINTAVKCVKGQYTSPFSAGAATRIIVLGTRLKICINGDPNWINLHPLAAIINGVATTYGLVPGVLIDHLKTKQDRNHSAHYTQKIWTYALKSEEFRLSDFITKHSELQTISELETTILHRLSFSMFVKKWWRH